ncbi:MAG: vWA domain-containing protein [Nannocystaceae bacterium]
MLNLRLPALAVPLCLSLAACPAEEDDGGSTNDPTMPGDSTSTGMPPGTTTTTPDPSGTTTGMPSDTSTGAPGTSTGEPDTGGSTMPEFVFDLGEIPEAPPLETECGKVDFLFVIDNSGSMGDEQANLVANFPAFIDGIQNGLEDVESYHVGVVTTDTYTTNIAGCQQLSSLVVQTPSGACGPYAEGANYMTEMDDLATAFTCAALVGTSGSASERQMQATVEAVTEVEGDPGECNEGFLREDSLLVIVIITDEPDNASTGDTMSWYNDILTARLGIPENVVVLSLINTPGGVCFGGIANEIAAFTTLWGMNGFMADICAPDYGPIFDQAIGVIDVACENYIPPD